MMPFSDHFGADVNVITSRAIYPTADGGTLSSASGAMTANTNTPTPEGGTVATPAFTTSGHGVWWWVGFLVFLMAMVWIARKAGGPEDFKNIRPTFYNFMTIVLSSIVGIVGLKVIAAKVRIPGATDLILAV